MGYPLQWLPYLTSMFGSVISSPSQFQQLTSVGIVLSLLSFNRWNEALVWQFPSRVCGGLLFEGTRSLNALARIISTKPKSNWKYNNAKNSATESLWMLSVYKLWLPKTLMVCTMVWFVNKAVKQTLIHVSNPDTHNDWEIRVKTSLWESFLCLKTFNRKGVNYFPISFGHSVHSITNNQPSASGSLVQTFYGDAGIVMKHLTCVSQPNHILYEPKWRTRKNNQYRKTHFFQPQKEWGTP